MRVFHSAASAVLLDQAALAFSSVKGRKVPEPADLSDQPQHHPRARPALGNAAELHMTLLCHTALHCIGCTAPSTLAASREKKPPKLRKFYMLPVTMISLNKHCFWPTLFTRRETTLWVTPHFPHRALWEDLKRRLTGPSACWRQQNKIKQTNKKAYWLCTIRVKSKFQCQTRLLNGRVN